jgi:hypothetical protein
MFSKSARYALIFAATNMPTAYQPSRTHQSAHSYAPHSHQNILRHPLEEHAPFRAILLPPKSVPARLARIPAKSTRDERRRRREQHRAFTARVRFAGPDSDAPSLELTDILNLDANGKPLTYSSAKRGPDRLAWERAEAEEIIRLILTGTIFPIPHSLVPKDRWTNNEIVYYNPVVKQKRNDDGTIQFRVRGTAGGNLLGVPYDVSTKTAGLDTVKLLIHSVISGDFKWMTIDITDFYEKLKRESVLVGTTNASSLF